MEQGDGRIVLQPSRPIVMDLGVQDYRKVLSLQRHLNSLRNDGLIGDVLIFLEHDDVYTMGIHRNASEVLAPGIDPVEVERGGSATYHGRGQVVAYFIINLKDRGINIRDLIENVEETISLMLKDYGVEAEGRLFGETGVWVGSSKICSVGFALKGFSTLHGIALNVSTDLSRFSAIMPCGMDSAVMTSIEKETGKQVDFVKAREELEEMLIRSLKIENYEKIDSFEKMGEYSVSNGLGLLPEELG